MRTNIPYVLEGEVFQIQPHVGTSRKPIRYIVKLDMPDGSTILVPNCITSTMFGGIDDNLQMRLRSSEDSGVDTETSSTDEKNAAQTGDRVYVAFIGGNIQKPVIIGYAQHPNQTFEFEDDEPADIDPRMVFKYLGMKATIDDKGQMRLIHRGAPTIKYEPKQSGALGALGDAAGALNTSGPGTDKANGAIKPQADTETTLFEFLEGGIFRIRDAEGQFIEIDRTQKRIYISNNDQKSTDAEAPLDPSDAEYVLLDKDAKKIELQARTELALHSLDARNDNTDGKYTHKVGENSEWEITGDETRKIDGNQETTIEKDYILKINGDSTETIKGDKKLDVTGDQKLNVTGDWKINVTGDVEITAGPATFSMKSGKFQIKGATGELLDLFDQDLDAFINNAATLVLTSVGPGQLSPAVVTLLGNIKGFLAGIKG